MQLTTFSAATLLALAASVSASSGTFTVLNTRSASQFHFTSWGVGSDGKVIIASEGVTLEVEDSTAVKTSDGKYLKVGSDGSITVVDSESDATTGFSIGAQSGSLIPLDFNGANNFLACKSGDNYQLFTSEGAGSDCTGINSYATGTDGDLSPFPAAGSSSASSSTSAAPAASGYHNTSTAVVSDIATTVVTITSCHENKCTTGPVTTGLTVVTSTKEGVQTVYTTYCPLTSTTPVTVAPSSSAHKNTTAPSASTFEGSANMVGGASVAAIAGLALALLI